MRDACSTADLMHNRVFAGMWVLTLALIAAQVVWPWSNVYLAPLLLASWGVFCSLNALRCGRLHCRIMGPLFVLAAATVVLMSRGLVNLSGIAFNIILLSGVVLGFVLEAVVGKYGESPPR